MQECFNEVKWEIPVNGVFHLSDRPGFGITLDETKIVDQRQVHWGRMS